MSHPILDVDHNIIMRLADICTDALIRGNKILFCGNGGSAEMSNHIAAEFEVKFSKVRKALASISLSANIATITACANDFGYEHIYSRQVEAIGKKGDVLFGLSTSGTSSNVVRALELAKYKGLYTVMVTGKNGANIPVDFNVLVNSTETSRIQETHLYILHEMIRLIDEKEF